MNTRPVGLSREAPVMVLEEEAQWISPGGAANAVSNCLSLSGSALCIGLVGDDRPGEMLLENLASRGADAGGIVTVEDAATYTKMRVFAGDLHTVKQQVMRLDRRPADRLGSAVERKVLEAITQAAKTADAWLISDYDGDLFSEAVIRRLHRVGGKNVMVVDSHRRLARFQGITCATPNESEAALASGVDIADDESAFNAATRIREAADCDWVFLTRGNKGMTIVGRNGTRAGLPIVGPSDIVDVAGAGDTVAAVVTLSLAQGADALTAALLAAYAASVVCMKTGVAAAEPGEIRAAIEEYPLPEIRPYAT